VFHVHVDAPWLLLPVLVLAAVAGSVAGAIVLMLWLNYSAWAILFGAELNSQLDRHADVHAAGGEHAGRTKPARLT